MPSTSNAIKQRQTLIDFTCQHSGTLESLFAVAESNGIGITEEVAPGRVLVAPQTDLKIIRVYEKSTKRDIVTDKDIDPLLGGIDYMGISIDFKVR